MTNDGFPGPVWRRLDHLAERSGVQAVVGKPHVLADRVALRRSGPTIGQAIAAIEASLGDAAKAPDDQPLFVLSAGWRSGSTLLQRLIVSTQELFLWGEPYDRCDLVPRLAESLRPFATGWPPPRYMYGEAGVAVSDGREGGNGQLAGRWIANLYPSVATLIESHRTLLRTLLKPPGGLSGAVWGMKEVRLSADHALYLRLLFPRARFVFLVRHPAQAYASYKRSPEWFYEWPDQQVRTARAFGQMWAQLAGSFVAHPDVPTSLLLRYEDLIVGGESISRLEEFLGASVDRSVLTNRVGSTNPGQMVTLGPVETRILSRYAGPVARSLGYQM